MRAPAYEEAREDGLRSGDADTRGMKQILGAFAILILSAAAADAQTCMGGTELGRSSHNRLLAGGTMADGTDGAGAGYGFGSNTFFGSVGMGFNRFEGLSGKQVAVNTLFGTQIPLPDRLPIAVCPLGQFDVAFGPNVDPVSFRTHTFSGGGRIGWMTGDPDNFNVVPTAGFSLVRTGTFASYSLLLIDQTMWDHYSVFHMGAGLRFNHSRMAVTPVLSFPMVNGADPTFNVTFSSSF
jgi:hypothetical protein